MPTLSEFVFYSVGDNPMRGLRSKAFSPLNPPKSGYYNQLQNTRWADTGVLQVRAGIPAALSSAIGASGIWRGAMSSVFNNVHGTIFSTTKDSSNKTHVWSSTDGATFTEITASSGKYGDTRIVADGSNNDYATAFAVVHDKFTAKDVAVFQNGYDSPRVYDGTSFVKHEAVPLPTNTNFMRTFASWVNHVPIGNPATFTVGGGGAGVVLTDGGVASPNDYAHLVINAAATGDNAFFTITTPLHWESAKQIHFIIEATSDAIRTFVQGIKITVHDTGGLTKSLYEPYDATVAGSDAFPQPFQTSIAGTSNWLVLSYPVPTDWITTTADKVTFTWAQAASSGASVTVQVLSVAASNYAASAIMGGFQHALSYYNAASRAESPEIVLKAQTQMLQALGVRHSTISDSKSTDGILIPNDPALAYTATIYYRNTTDTQRDKGVDSLRVYRQDFGEDVFYYAKTITLATWAPSTWSYSAGSASTLQNSTDGTDSGSRLFWLPSPGSFQQPIPIGRAMIAANQRLLVGAKTVDAAGTVADAYPRVCLSRAIIPFRFAEISDPNDPYSAAEDRLPGENVQSFVAAPGEYVGSSSVICFTDSAAWSINTHVPSSSLLLTRVSTIGTNCPLSVVERDGRIYFIDTDMRVRRLGQPGWISEDVDDKFQGIPSAYRRNVCGMWHNDRVYFAYTPLGGTANTRALIYSERVGAWESDDLLPSQQADFFIRWVGSSGTYATSQDPRILYLNSSDRKCYRYESGTTDLGSKIAIVVTTGDLQKELWQAYTNKRWGIMCEAATDTLTGALSFKPIPSPTGLTGGANVLSSANTYDWAWSTVYKSGTVSAAGPAMSISITGSLPGSLRILALCLDPALNSQNARGQ
jgi:hypothetical protein